MNRLIDIFSDHRRDIENALTDCQDAKEATDAAAFWIQKAKDEYLLSEDMPYERKRVNALFSAALSAVGLMSSVSETQISMRIQPTDFAPVKRIRGWRDLWAYRSYLAAALSGLLAVWLFLSDMNNPAVLALLAAVASLVSGKSGPAAPQHPQPSVTGTAKANVQELMRRLERLMTDLDDAIEGTEERYAAHSAELTSDTLEAVQMLIEAHLTGDGAFALKTVPRMTGALRRQGIEMVMYSKEDKQYFDLYPAEEGGETIRPALLLGEEVLMRGHATIKA